MPGFSNASAAAYLLKPERSRGLAAWWLALHLTLALSIALICPWPMLTVIALGLLAALAWRGRPRTPPLMVYSPGGPWSLPQSELFGLALSPATRYGRHWVELVFDDPAAGRILLLRDQIAAPAWRQLLLALIEAG